MTKAAISESPSQPRVYQALVIAKALELWTKGIRVNRAYTPTAMLLAAGRLTGRKYKRGAYAEAANDLRALVEGLRKEV